MCLDKGTTSTRDRKGGLPDDADTFDAFKGKTGLDGCLSVLPDRSTEDLAKDDLAVDDFAAVLFGE